MPGDGDAPHAPRRKPRIATLYHDPRFEVRDGEVKILMQDGVWQIPEHQRPKLADPPEEYKPHSIAITSKPPKS